MIQRMIVLLMVGCILSCSGGDGERRTIAHITSRTAGIDGSVVVRYRFEANGKWLSDSMLVAPGIIVPHDSVQLLVLHGPPSKSRLLLP